MRTLILSVAAMAACGGSAADAVDEESGVLTRTPDAAPGFTLIAPFGGQETFLIDLDGRVVHRWKTDRKPSQAAYLLPDGCLLRTAKVENNVFRVPGGPAGAIQKFDWDGRLLWDFEISDDQRMSHHDVEPLPNGNVLVVVWYYHSKEEAVAAGRNPDSLADDCLWSESVLEIRPNGLHGGDVVWQWNLWDHLIQHQDPKKPNYARPDERPDRIDINYAERPIADWIHMNSVDYNPELDQILLCGRTFDEIWIIDHSTTTREASGSEGGRSGKGGDILYRWGNPFTYFTGTPFDQVLFGQHDPHWIPNGLPGAGHILIFNNGSDRDQRPFSSVDEIIPPLSDDGTYRRQADSAFGPEAPIWSWKDPARLYSQRVSGAQRLPNGNTLICSGETGYLIEVTASGEIVWEYRNTLGATPNTETTGAGPGPLRGGAMFRAHRYAPDHPAIAARIRNKTP